MYQIGCLTNVKPDDAKFDDLGQAMEEAINMESSTKMPVDVWDLEDGRNILAIVFQGSVFK